MRITSFSDIPEIDEYATLVTRGEIEACEEQHQLMVYLARIFASEELHADPDQIAKYMSYQRYFPFDLYPWERFVFALHNCVFRADGSPRWQDLLLYMGRGGGKNGYISFEDFCLTTPTNGIRNYHIDICANSEEQARTSFDEIYDILESPTDPRDAKALRHNFYWNKTVIRNRLTGSEIKYRTNNAKSKDGLRSGKVDFDEIHAYENWDNLNVFTTGLGKKPCPRITYATTDGDFRDGPLDQLKDRALKILSGELDDNGLLPFVCRLDDDEEVHDESKWEKANPSLRYKPELVQRIRTEYQNYLLDPVKNAAFMTKRMNRPQGNADVQVTSWENVLKTNRPLPDLTGWPCVVGIDFSKTTDFMSAVLLFRDSEERPTYYAIHHSWFCTRSKDRGRIKIPLDEMERRGLLTMVDDVEIDPSLVCEWIGDMRQTYDVRKVAADSYRYALLKRELAKIGFDANDKTVKMVRPSDVMYAQGKIDSAFAHGGIVWGDDPLMRWYVNNTKLVRAPNNNFKYEKIEPSSRKTDGFMAFVHAFTLEEEIPEHVTPRILPTLVFA